MRVTHDSRTPLFVSAAGLCLILCACESTGASAAPDVEPAMTHQHHTIDYIEFTVSDMAAAQRFYGAAFGWAFTDYGPEYAGIQRPGGGAAVGGEAVGGEAVGGEVGGLRLDTTVQHGGPLVVLYSADLEASARAVQAAGGRIVREPFAFPGGRRFHFLDPSGNELAVWGP